ncbi:MAG TPA: glycerol-3-phosphate 1-O-acyltransferase PlsY [Opitutaceae bacterium]|jgi:glycerol-3-phosphate acyltransferase PlsY|nr:glycerol-3-phosphate 1-O-acyltransferase PlsY [Opitutaceae bacterium]
MAGTADQGALLVPLVVAAVAGYILGSLPFGYLVARSKGVNIFEVGSKSSGATNVRRTLGSGPGNIVLVLDMLKGSVAAGWPLLVAWGAIRTFNVPSVLGYVGLGFALLGHSFSCFTKFRGGKGVATGAGGLAVLMPNVALVSVLVWLAVFFAARYVSLASIAAALSLPAAAFLFHRDSLALSVAGAIALFVIIRHRANIVRLMNGTEKRIEKKKDKA